jgi:hypothetical protein
MYCSFCGAALTPGLSYCNRCGAELGAKDRIAAGPKEAPQESVVWGIVAVTVVGLGGIIGLMAVMKNVLQFNDGLIIVFSLLFFLAFLGVDAVFIWLLLRSKIDYRYGEGLAQQKVPSTLELSEARARVLPEPAASITEHTTRTMDPVDEERHGR